MSPTAALLQVKQLNVGFGRQPILNQVTFNVASGRTLVVLGESGCGKTTLLRALAGLIPISSGEISLNGRPVTRSSPRDRGVIYLDQEPLLFEHLTVKENIAFAMRFKKFSCGEIDDAVQRMLTAIDLCEHAHKHDWQLSGGQKQRVAFARAVLARPRLLLLDEPFGSLDSKSRSQMQALFAQLSRDYGLTSIFVTHDAKEALILGDQFARISEGKLSLYADRQAFINDEATGIPSEIAFWKQSAELLDGRI